MYASELRAPTFYLLFFFLHFLCFSLLLSSSLRVVTDMLRVCECTVVSDSWRPLDHNPTDGSVHEILQDKNAIVGCHFLPRGLFPTQGSNPHLLCLLHWQVGSLPLSHLESPLI